LIGISIHFCGFFLDFFSELLLIFIRISTAMAQIISGFFIGTSPAISQIIS
jgi:hypothetical protein